MTQGHQIILEALNCRPLQFRKIITSFSFCTLFINYELLSKGQLKLLKYFAVFTLPTVPYYLIPELEYFGSSTI